jgi:hypothetical protein
MEKRYHCIFDLADLYYWYSNVETDDLEKYVKGFLAKICNNFLIKGDSQKDIQF